MRRKTEIRTTRSSAVSNIIAGIAFILFGLFVPNLLHLDGGMGMGFGGPSMNPALFFTVFGLIGGIASILYGVIALKRGGIAEHEIVTETTDESRWNSASDPAEQLKKLKSLYDDGILSSAEYEMKKKEILSKKW